jgi:hypothetical protein
MQKIAKWGSCSERQARRNIRTLECWGFLQPIEAQKGGNKSTRFCVDLEVIISVARCTGANPHPKLISAIRVFKPDMPPGQEAGQMSAGIFISNVDHRGAGSTNTADVTFPSQANEGDEDA